MKRNKRRCIAGLAALCLSLSGCEGNFFPTARDITNVQLMRTMAMDRGEEGGTLVTVSGGAQPGSQGGEGQPPVILEWEAPTVFAACLRIQTYGDGYISFGHVGQCVVSTDCAEEAVTGLLDFVERDFEMRVSADFFVTEGKAADLLKEMADKSKAATDRLESIRKDLLLESEGWPVTVRELLIDLEENGCAVAPVVEVQEVGEEKTLSCSRMCWFRQSRYGDTLSEEESRSATILSNEAKSGSFEVTLSDGSVAGLRMTEADCRWEPVRENGRLTGAKAKVRVKADLAELHGSADVFDRAVIEEMEQSLEQTLKQQMEQVMQLSQQEQADFLHIGRAVRMRQLVGSEKKDADWEKWFPRLKLTAEVTGTIQRSYDVSRSEETA